MKKILISLFFLTSCATIILIDEIDEDVVASWQNVPVEELDTHSFFLTIPVIKTISGEGIEIRNYRNGTSIQQCSEDATLSGSAYISYSAFTTCTNNNVVCNNIFYINDGFVKEYRLVGSCSTAEFLRPEYKVLAIVTLVPA